MIFILFLPHPNGETQKLVLQFTARQLDVAGRKKHTTLQFNNYWIPGIDIAQ
jgi:hypothetical protein